MENRRQPYVDDDRCSPDEHIAGERENVAAGRESQKITKVTVVLPLRNEQENIKIVVTDVLDALSSANLAPRILLVDDGSEDASLTVLQAMATEDSRVSYISFSRNFGKESAIMAGLRECGDDFDALAYMDSDGQHSASDLLHLIDAAQESDVDLVCGVRSSREYQTARQQRMARLFYRLFRRMSDAPIDEGAGDFNVMRPKVVQALREMHEDHPFMKGLVGWIGFRKKLVPVTIEPRAGGMAKSSTRKMLKLAFGAFLSFSSWPLRAWSVIGIGSALLALLYLMFVILQTALFGRDVPGYATMVVLLLGLGGLQLFSIGILGEYVARIYDASKRRPRYIIARSSKDG